MKQHAYKVLSAIAFLLGSVLAHAADDDPKLEEVRAKVSAMFEGIDPEHVVTPGIFVDDVVEVPDPVVEQAA